MFNFTTPLYFQHHTYRHKTISPLVKYSEILPTKNIGIDLNPTDTQTLEIHNNI